jgi:uncharacterized protein
VAEAWKLGRKGVDDGVLLLVAKNDRKVRIEVGRGLEGAIPDAAAKRIVAEIVTPRFKQGDFEGGIREGVERIVRVIEGEPLPSPRRVSAPTGGTGTTGSSGSSSIPIILVVGHRPRVHWRRCRQRRDGDLDRLLAGSCVWLLAGVVAGLPPRVPRRSGVPWRLVLRERLERREFLRGGGSDFSGAAVTSAAAGVGRW